MLAIKVGQPVDIVLEQGVIKPSSVQDIVDDRIVLVQVVPSLDGSYLNKTILVTYLTKADRHVRMAFRATIVEIREGYVTFGRGFPVIIVTPASVSEVCDLRAHTRQRPYQKMTVKLDAEDLEIIDISAGNAHLVRQAGIKARLKVDGVISLVVLDGQEKWTKKARIIRQWHTKGEDGPEHLAVVFITEQ